MGSNGITESAFLDTRLNPKIAIALLGVIQGVKTGKFQETFQSLTLSETFPGVICSEIILGLICGETFPGLL